MFGSISILMAFHSILFTNCTNDSPHTLCVSGRPFFAYHFVDHAHNERFFSFFFSLHNIRGHASVVEMESKRDRNGYHFELKSSNVLDVVSNGQPCRIGSPLHFNEMRWNPHAFSTLNRTMNSYGYIAVDVDCHRFDDCAMCQMHK